MKVPIDKNDFSVFIAESDIFKLTKESLFLCLDNWYKDEYENFIENMRADLNTVMNKYSFSNDMVSISKDFQYDIPLDTVSCKIRIYDSDGDYCMIYHAVFDYDLNIIDDFLY